MPYALCPNPKFRAFDANGNPLAGGKVYTYEPGDVVPKASYTDNTGGTANANPVILDANGEASIWLNGFYKIVLKNSSDVLQWSVDQVSSMPAESNTVFSEWLSNGLTPTYVAATQFSVPGDETTRFQVGRRIKATVTAGTVYGTIKASAYTTLTTVTVTLDSGSLDSGLSAVYESILSVTNNAIPGLYIIPRMTTTQRDTYTAANGMVIYNTTTSRYQIYNGSWLNLVDTNSTDTLVNKTLTAPIIVTTGYIADAGGDKYIEFVEGTTPVNWLRIESANTTVGPKISAQGETNVDLQLEAKGTGQIKFNSKVVGAWEAKSVDTVYQAASDGFVIGYVSSGRSQILTDSSNPPTTVRQDEEVTAAGSGRGSMMCPVKKGDYWKYSVVSGATNTVFWIPLGA